MEQRLRSHLRDLSARGASAVPRPVRVCPSSGVLLVSIHDVTPALDERVRTLWAMCRARGVTPALLVVPNWHGEWPLDRSPAFVQWVRECVDNGAEVLLHGERHDEAGTPRGWRDAARAWGKTAREGEFLTLEEPAARERIDRGLALFSRLGLDAVGFVPPAWLARTGCVRAVAAAGLRSARTMARSTSTKRAACAGSRHPWYGGAAGRPSEPTRRRPSRRRGGVFSAAPGTCASHFTRRISIIQRRRGRRATALDRWLGDRPASRYSDL